LAERALTAVGTGNYLSDLKSRLRTWPGGDHFGRMFRYPGEAVRPAASFHLWFTDGRRTKWGAMSASTAIAMSEVPNGQPSTQYRKLINRPQSETRKTLGRFAAKYNCPIDIIQAGEVKKNNY
jgi:hypothetical protein